MICFGQRGATVWNRCRGSEGNKAHVKGSVGQGIVTQLAGKLLMFVFSRSHLSHLQQQAANSKEKLEGMNQVIHVVAFSSGHWWRCQIIQLVSLKLQPFFWHHWLFFIPCDHCLKPGLPTFISTAAGPHREDRHSVGRLTLTICILQNFFIFGLQPFFTADTEESLQSVYSRFVEKRLMTRGLI